MSMIYENSVLQRKFQEANTRFQKFNDPVLSSFNIALYAPEPFCPIHRNDRNTANMLAGLRRFRHNNLYRLLSVMRVNQLVKT